MSSRASRLLLQPPTNTRTPPFTGSKQSPATENLAEGPSPVVISLVHAPVSAPVMEDADNTEDIKKNIHI
jgi:hypothetical protein